MFSLFSSSQSNQRSRDTSAIRSRAMGTWWAQGGAALMAIVVLVGMHVEPPALQGKNDAPQHVPQAKAKRVVASSLPADGEEIYNTRCMSCHQMGGRGVPGTFPPISDTEWVNGDKGRLIRLLLNGMNGTIEVKGTTYSGTMPPWGGALSNEEIAQVSTFIRSNFGNDAPPITTEEVAQVREATKARKKPWTAEELSKEANQGIPGDSTSSE